MRCDSARRAHRRRLRLRLEEAARTRAQRVQQPGGACAELSPTEGAARLLPVLLGEPRAEPAQQRLCGASARTRSTRREAHQAAPRAERFGETADAELWPRPALLRASSRRLAGAGDSGGDSAFANRFVTRCARPFFSSRRYSVPPGGPRRAPPAAAGLARARAAAGGPAPAARRRAAAARGPPGPSSNRTLSSVGLVLLSSFLPRPLRCPPLCSLRSPC